MAVLVVYSFRRNGESQHSYHYAVSPSAVKWILEMAESEYDDGDYSLVNAIEITDDEANAMGDCL